MADYMAHSPVESYRSHWTSRGKSLWYMDLRAEAHSYSALSIGPVWRLISERLPSPKIVAWDGLEEFRICLLRRCASRNHSAFRTFVWHNGFCDHVTSALGI